MALGGRLDLALASVALGGDAGDGIGFLLLLNACVSHVRTLPSSPAHVDAYLEQLVGRLLVLSGHGVRHGLGERSDDAKDGQAGGDAYGDAPGDAGVGARRVDGTGAVRAEGDPVCWPS